MRLFSRVFHHVHAKLHNIPRTHLKRLTLVTRLTEPLIVDECAVTTPGILDEEFAFVVPQLGMISREDFAVKDGVWVGNFGACDGSAYFDYFVGLQQEGAGLLNE